MSNFFKPKRGRVNLADWAFGDIDFPRRLIAKEVSAAIQNTLDDDPPYLTLENKGSYPACYSDKDIRLLLSLPFGHANGRTKLDDGIWFAISLLDVLIVEVEDHRPGGENAKEPIGPDDRKILASIPASLRRMAGQIEKRINLYVNHEGAKYIKPIRKAKATA